MRKDGYAENGCLNNKQTKSYLFLVFFFAKLLTSFHIRLVGWVVPTSIPGMALRRHIFLIRFMKVAKHLILAYLRV